MIWLGLEPAVLALPQGSPEAPARTVLEIIALLVRATFLTRKAFGTHSSTATAPLAGDLAGDPVLQMMVDLSILPAPPVYPVPSSTDSWAAWHGLGGSDLAWIANDSASTVFARRAARAELQRRAIRNADPVTAGTLIRRTGPLSRR